MRHFEVYLGQWSISGPGRAFRIIPIFDGIGIAICINSLVRAVNCCTIAAISVIYVVHSVSDSKLPYTYCRDFDLKPYDPIVRDVSNLTLREFRFSLATGEIGDDELMDGTANGDELYNMRGIQFWLSSVIYCFVSFGP
ncbi:unnamed protein product [Leptidea sinapis]|uniref:Uncharacterized protein n=1 Tax=Leptidea sinapis TaxID=189913 RepID=A0A5E4QB02_9NEOP|nr:unnamed protein product [Leptidea sinapis]